MKGAFLALVVLALVVFGVVVAAEALDSAATGWAAGMEHVANRDIAVAQIEADTKITLTQLGMIESANMRTMLGIMFFPLLGCALLGVFMAIKLFSTPSPTDQQRLERNAMQGEKAYWENR